MENKKKGKKVQHRKLSPAGIFAFALLSIFIVFFIIGQIYIVGVENSITTEIALADSATKSVTVDMFAVRDEKIISSSAPNVVSAVSDGSRVGAKDTVAYSFSDSTSAGNIIRLAEIEELLDYYSALMNKSATVAGNTQVYDDEIMNDLYSFAGTVASGRFIQLSDVQSNIRDAITSKQTATGVELDVTASITSLRSEYSQLKASTGKYTEIKSGGTGYYISGTDGYENVLRYSEVDDWTIDDVLAATQADPEPTDSKDVGRLVHGYYWYLACVTDTSAVNNLKEGSRKTIVFPDSTVDDIIAQVYAVKSDPSGKTLVIFRCNLMNEELASLRCDKAKIIIEDHEGYRIDNRAIRVNEDNETGVYVISGSTMYFKKINIVYSSQDYSIVTNPYRDDVTMRNKYLNLYDEYIIEGMELEDGKLIE